MALIVEDGTGVAGAESYASVDFADNYWTLRPHLAQSSAWLAETTSRKEGMLREATAYTDATWGPHYRGVRAGYIQGLLWPRTGAVDETGYELPALPAELPNVVCELVARAVSAPLSSDVSYEDAIKRLKAGSVEIEFVDSTTNRVVYGTTTQMLWGILDGTQDGASRPTWFWR